MGKGNLESLIGAGAVGGLTALALKFKYGTTVLAAAALGVYYPLAVIGGTFIGAYLGKYLSS